MAEQKQQTATAAALASGKLYGLQYLRGFGILLVLAHHAGSYTTAYMPLEWNDSFHIMSVRHLHLFFVISGLIMMYIHASDTKGWASMRVYFLKRHIRIFPMVFAVVTAGALGLYAANQLGLGQHVMGWAQYFNSMLIYPMTEPPQPIVLWTLRNELIFYLVFGLFFVNRWVFWLGMAAWLISSFLLGERGLVGEWNETGALHNLQENIFFESFFWDFNYLFVMGIVGYYATQWLKDRVTWSERHITWAYVIVYLAFAFASFRDDIFSPHNASTNYIIGVLTMLLMFFSVGVRFHKSIHSTLLYMGDASYSIYLVHMVVIAFAAPVIGPFAPSTWSLFFAFMVLGTVGGLAAYEFFEKPALKYLRRFAK